MSSEYVDETSLQLTGELQQAVLRSFDFRHDRPTLKHLNADSSWLLSLPYPRHVEAPGGRCRFNIVIDPWLKGFQADLFSWFSSQEHATPSIFQSLDEVNSQLIAAESRALDGTMPNPSKEIAQDQASFIDAVICSHEFTDHCHEATLRELHPDVPVFAPRKAVSLVKSWKHFQTVVEIPVLTPSFDWKSSPQQPLPDWIGLGRVHTRGDAPIYFHSAICIVFSLTSRNGGELEAVVYTPHGASAESMQVITEVEPQTRVLALLHGLHDISLAGAQLNMGMKNALQAKKLLNAKYWFPTHDERKVAHGIVAPFLRRVEHTLQVAPGSHPITEVDASGDSVVTDSSFFELANGESFVLT